VPPRLPPGWISTTLDADTPHLAASRQPADCHQPRDGVHLGSHAGDLASYSLDCVTVSDEIGRARQCPLGIVQQLCRRDPDGRPVCICADDLDTPGTRRSKAIITVISSPHDEPADY